MKKYILSLLFLFVCSSSYATVACNDDTTPGIQVCKICAVGDNCTDEDYNTLTAWEAAKNGDLVSAQQIRVAELHNDDGDIVDDEIVIDGSTTSADYYMKITVAEGKRHNGTADESGTILSVLCNGDCAVISIKDNYTVVEWLDITNLTTTGSVYTYFFGININANYVTIRNNLIHGFTNFRQKFSAAIGSEWTSGNYAKIYNNMIFNVGGGADASQPVRAIYPKDDTYVEVYNNTVYNILDASGSDVVGIESNSTSPTNIIKNNISIMAEGVAFSLGELTVADYNASSDLTATGDNSLTEIADTIFTATTAGSENLHIVEGAGVIGEGVALVLEFENDIDDEIRGGTWDIGADQYETTTNTPITTAFSIPSFSRNLELDITTWDTFIGSGNSITGYCLEETGVEPALDSNCWVAEEPTTYTFDSNGEKTLYAWLKADNNEISSALSDTVEMRSLVGLSYGVWVNNGEDKVRQDEVRELDEETTTNEIWDGTTIRIKEGTNAFAQFSVYIEAGENTLTDISVEMSSLINGENVITYNTREDVFDYTASNIEILYARYIQIRGLKGGGNNYDADFLPENRWSTHMQRPSSPVWVASTIYYPGYYKQMANNGTLWEDRPGHDKYFPDALIPIELEPTFDIASATSQQIWVDVWIPKDMPIGTYSGTFTVKDGTEMLHEIPVELEVYNFELPDEHYLGSWGWTPFAFVIDRWLGTLWPAYNNQTTETKAIMDELWNNYVKVIRRHGIYHTSDNGFVHCNLSYDHDYGSTYNLQTGAAFSVAKGYDGPGIGMPYPIYIIGSYGSWRHNSFGIPYTTETFTGSGLNDMQAKNYNGMEYTENDISYVVKIDGTGTPDTFKWSDDGGSTWDATTVAITGNEQDLDEYTYIDFGATTGHTLNDQWAFSSRSYDELAVIIQDYADSCYDYLEAINPGVKKMLWIIDEPGNTQSSWDLVEDISAMIDGATGGGANIQTYTTGDITGAIDYNAPSLDVGINNGRKKDTFNRPDEYRNPEIIIDGYNANEQEWLGLGHEIQQYNNFPWEISGSGFHGGWQAFKDDVAWQMLWSMAEWVDDAGGYHYWNEKTDVWTMASTYGNTGDYDDPEGEYGRFVTASGNGDGTILYPGTDIYYKEYTFDANSGTLEDFSACTTDAGATTALCIHQDNDRGVVRAWVRTGAFNDNDVLTDGTSSVTLTGSSAYPDTNYGVNGVFASIRLKLYRKSMQDYDYLYMASQNCSSCVDSILTSVGIHYKNDTIMDWSNISYGVGWGWDMKTIVYGSTDDFERARAKLANIILGTNPPSEFKGSLTGFSK